MTTDTAQIIRLRVLLGLNELGPIFRTTHRKQAREELPALRIKDPQRKEEAKEGRYLRSLVSTSWYTRIVDSEQDAEIVMSALQICMPLW